MSKGPVSLCQCCATPTPLAHLDKGIDCENDKLRLRLCIVDQVEVDELLLLKIISLHVLEYIWEQAADVLQAIRVVMSR